MSPRVPAIALALLLSPRAWPQDAKTAARSRDARGVALAQSGRVHEAIGEFRAALQLDPDFPDAVYHLGLAYDASGQTDEAIAQAEEALRRLPGFPPAEYLLAGCCRKRGDFEGELRLLARITKCAPGFADARYNYGIALQRDGKLAEAVEELRAAAQMDPKYLLALGLALAGRDANEAVRVLRAAVEVAPQEPERRYDLALALAAAGREDDAIPEFRAALRIDPKHAAARRGLGIALLHADQLQAATAELRQALEIAPRDAETANNLGLVQLRLNDIAAAIQSLELAIRINPRLIKAHYNLAKAYQRAGRPQDARSETEIGAGLTAEQRSLGRAMVLVQSARQRLEAKDFPAALQAAREAVAASPRFPDAQFELGRAILASHGVRAEAVRAFREVLNLDPERSDAHYQLGLALLDSDAKAALEELRAAALMAPCRVEFMRALARAAEGAGDGAAAADQLRRIRAWEPDDQSAAAHH
ncbi:MAG: tetratricopeptide repeat protein [Acidobacteriia bacterium]|nr:tetratricopeptide repeat protein [Terriglobia bacterium]